MIFNTRNPRRYLDFGGDEGKSKTPAPTLNLVLGRWHETQLGRGVSCQTIMTEANLETPGAFQNIIGTYFHKSWNFVRQVTSCWSKIFSRKIGWILKCWKFPDFDLLIDRTHTRRSGRFCTLAVWIILWENVCVLTFEYCEVFAFRVRSSILFVCLCCCGCVGSYNCVCELLSCCVLSAISCFLTFEYSEVVAFRVRSSNSVRLSVLLWLCRFLYVYVSCCLVVFCLRFHVSGIKFGSDVMRISNPSQQFCPLFANELIFLFQ